MLEKMTLVRFWLDELIFCYLWLSICQNPWGLQWWFGPYWLCGEVEGCARSSERFKVTFPHGWPKRMTSYDVTFKIFCHRDRSSFWCERCCKKSNHIYEVGEVLTFDQLTPEQQKKDERINAFAVPILSIPMFGSLNFIELSNGRWWKIADCGGALCQVSAFLTQRIFRAQVVQWYMVQISISTNQRWHWTFHTHFSAIMAWW